MITIYTVPSCSSCKKAEHWLREHDLQYRNVNLLTDDIKAEDIKNILSLTDVGTDEIISTRSKAYARLNTNFDNVSINRLVQLIEENRTLLRRPLIFDDKRLQVGYNEDDIRKFLPRNFREIRIQKEHSEIAEFAESPY